MNSFSPAQVETVTSATSEQCVGSTPTTTPVRLMLPWAGWRHRWSEAVSGLSLLYWILRILLRLSNQKFLFGFIFISFNSQPYATASNQPVPIGDNTQFLSIPQGGIGLRWRSAAGSLLVAVPLGRCGILLSEKDNVLIGKIPSIIFATGF